MTNVLFIQNLLFEFLGPAHLASYLISKGHKAEIIVNDNEFKVIDQINQTRPDLIAFSIMSTNHDWAFKMAETIKQNYSVPIIFGGPHPTYFPEMIDYPAVDIICIGEGEEALAELADRLEKNQPITDIENLWVKKSGKIYKNPVRRLISNLDSLPFPNREVYYSKYPFLKKLTTKRFLASRGCPYNCTYCFNHKLKEIYGGKGVYLRWRSPENIVQEIKQVKEKYPLKTVRFVDDTFTLNKKWLYGLLAEYKREIKLPFTCLIRANEVDEDLVKALKEANCAQVSFGIETGDEDLRNRVLGKNLKDQEIINAASLFRKYKIKFGTYNMICLPGETLEQAFKTLELNAKIRTNNPMCSVFQPFPRTRLTAYALEKGLLAQNFDVEKIRTIFEGTQLKISQKKELLNLHKFFMLGAWFPWTIPMIRYLIRLPDNKIFDWIYKLSYGIRAFKSYRINLFTAIQLGYRLRNRFQSK